MAQILPALVGGLFWRGATRIGARLGLVTGFAVWAYTFFLPSFGPGAVLPPRPSTNGPFGLALLRPEALFGIGGMDPFVHAVLWSLLLNTAAFILGSLLTFPQPIERLQGASFVERLSLQQRPDPRGGAPTRAMPRTSSSWPSASSATARRRRSSSRSPKGRASAATSLT